MKEFDIYMDEFGDLDCFPAGEKSNKHLRASPRYRAVAIFDSMDPASYVPATMAETEKRHILFTMKWANHNKTRAADALGITIKTLYTKLHAYGYMDNPEAFK